MLEGVSTSDLLMYAGIFVLALALIVLVLWVSRISSKMTALTQTLMIEQRKLEELERQLGIDVGYTGASAVAGFGADGLANAATEAAGRVASAAPATTRTLEDFRRGARAESKVSTGEIEFENAYIDDLDPMEAPVAESIGGAGFDGGTGAGGSALVLSDAQSLRQQEQMQRISRARERQAKLKQKHSDEMSAELRRKRELARQREEQVRIFQQQQEELRRRIALEQAEAAAEEERLNKLRTRASWSGAAAGSGRPRQRASSSARLEERRQAQLRRKAEQILQTRLGNAGETDNFGNSVDFR